MKNNNIFRQFFRNAPFPCVHHEILRNDQGRHEDYRFIGVNEAFTRLINTRHKKLDGLTVRQVLSGPGSKDSGLTGLYEKIFERNGIAALEHFFPGTGEWYTVNAWQTDGSHIAVSFTDVTERKQAEKERESAMLILQSALAQSPSGILIADAPDVTIRWANEAALGIRGDSELPLTGIDVSKHSISWQTLRLDGTPVPSEELPLSRAILKGETVCNEEVIIRHASGEDRYVSANSAPIRDSSGEIRAGSGLGLTIARGMVSLIGGTIRVESVKGEGSTFFFTLPQVAILMESESPKSCPPDSPDSGDPVVLIAEDDESSAQLVQVIIQKAGLQTLLAWNGEEAVGLCHQYPEISLVFMDIKMPVMNGLEATARIKEFRPDLPVIALTAHAQSGDRTRMLEAGCDDYIAKPLIKSTILDILQKFKQIS